METTIYSKPNGKDPIFRCPDEQWAEAIERSKKDRSQPMPMPWNHVMWANPSAYGYIHEQASEEETTEAWEAMARAFLPDNAAPIIVRGCAKAMRMGANPVPFLAHELTTN